MKFNSLKRHAAILLSAAIALSSFTGCSIYSSGNNTVTTESNEQSTFDAFLNDVFVDSVTSDLITLNYSIADYASYGITDYNKGYGDLDLSKLDDDSELVDTLTTLNSFNYELLSSDQKLTYTILKKTLETELEYSDMYLYEKILSPTIGLQSQLPVILSEYSFRTVQDIYDYISLIEQTDEYFDYILSIVKMQADAGMFMEDEIADKVIDQCSIFIADPENNYLIEIFNDKVLSFDGLTDSQCNEMIAKNQAAVLNHLIPAYENMIDTLTKLKGTGRYSGGLCSYPDGLKYYEYLIKNDVGTDRSIDELDSLLDKYIYKGYSQMRSVLNKNSSILDTIDSYEFCQTDPELILEDLQGRITEYFPKLPACDYTIKYVHSSLEEYMSPAFYMVPALDEYRQNSIYINQKSVNEGQMLYPTLAHEGFPGHLYQNVYFLSTNPNPVRTQLNFSGYSEGWATYTELMSYEMGGIDSDAGKLLSSNSLITLCLYGKMDIGINAKEWTKEDTASFIYDYFGIDDEDTVNEVYDAMVSEPANYLKYIIGCIEFMELKDDCSKLLSNDFNLKDFHEAVLLTGPCDFTTLKENVTLLLTSSNSGIHSFFNN